MNRQADRVELEVAGQVEALSVANCWEIQNSYRTPDFHNSSIMVGEAHLFRRTPNTRLYPDEDTFKMQKRLHEAVGLVRGTFQGANGYRISLEQIDSLSYHLPVSSDDQLKQFANEFAEIVRQRRDQENMTQKDELNWMLDNDAKDTWVLLVTNNETEPEVSYSAAKLKGFFVTRDDEGVPIPGLLLEGKDGRIGTLPPDSYQFGVYK